MTGTEPAALSCGTCRTRLGVDEASTCRACVADTRAHLAAITAAYRVLPALLDGLGSNAPQPSRGRTAERPLPGGDVLVLLGPGSSAIERLRAYLAGQDPDWDQDDRPADPPSVAYELERWVSDWRRLRREDAAGRSSSRGAGGKAAPPEMHTPCVIWDGRLTREGYGRLDLPAPGGQVYAHRHAYERVHGPIPDDLTTDHLCWNPACVNVDHMELVTRAENIRRASARITHCPQGHPYDDDNTMHYVQPKSGGIGRKCRECHRQWARERRADRRGWTAEESLVYLHRHLTWAARRHPGFPEFATDLTRLRRRVEAAAGLDDRPERAGVPCFGCGGPLERPYGHQGREDDWTCARCRRVYTRSAYLLAVRATLEGVDR